MESLETIKKIDNDFLILKLSPLDPSLKFHPAKIPQKEGVYALIGALL